MISTSLCPYSQQRTEYFADLAGIITLLVEYFLLNELLKGYYPLNNISGIDKKILNVYVCFKNLQYLKDYRAVMALFM